MGVGLLGRKSDAFAALLDGSATGTTDPALVELSKLVQRLSAVPAPAAAFREGLREHLIATGTTTAPPAPPAAGGDPGSGTGSSGTGSSGAGSSGTGATGAGSAGTGSAGAAGTAGGSAGAAGAAGAAGTAGGATGGAISAAIAAVTKTAPLWIKLAVAGTAIAVSGTGVGVSAHRALPGDFFYGVKRQVENVQLELASGAQEKALTQLGFAHARADEIQALIKRAHVAPGDPLPAGVVKDVQSALEDWAQEAGEATTSLVKQIRALGSAPENAALSTRLRERLSEFTTGQFAQLGSTLTRLPAGAVRSLTVSALGYLQRVDRVLGGSPGALVQGLVQQLQVPLSSLPDVSDLETVLHLPAGTVNGIPLPIPLQLPRLPVQLPSGLPLPSLGGRSGGQLPTPRLSLPSVPPLSIDPGRVVPPNLIPPNLVPSGVIPPNVVPSIVIPSNVVPPNVLPSRLLPTAVLPSGLVPRSLNPPGVLPTVGPGGGKLGGTVDKTVDGVDKTVDGVTKTVTGAGKTVTGTVTGVVNGVVQGPVKGTVGTVTGGITSPGGPALPLPTEVPTLPPLPVVSGLGGLGGLGH